MAITHSIPKKRAAPASLAVSGENPDQSKKAIGTMTYKEPEGI
jgi:hypothetical protein